MFLMKDTIKYLGKFKCDVYVSYANLFIHWAEITVVNSFLKRGRFL
jgi:hypothetical protein